MAEANAAETRRHQRLRERRMLIGSLSYLVTLSLVLAFWYLGEYGIDVVRNYVAAVLSLVAFFFMMIRTNRNLRFADPSMTLAQVALSILPAYYVMFHSQQARSVFLILVISAAMYGLFQFRMRDFLVLSLVVIGGYALMIVLLYTFRPAEIHLKIELLQLFSLTATFLQFSGLGGFIAGLRNKVKIHLVDLATRNGELVEALQRIEDLAMRDELTGVFNRRFLMETIRNEKVRGQRSGSQFTLCILDVDHFKRVNDQFGHHAGDQVLQEIARVANDALRQTDYFGRYGGEEFAMVLTDTVTEGAIVTAERVRRRIEEIDFSSISQGFRVTVSIGIADSQQAEDAALTFKRADQALYLAKEAGRNRCVIAPLAHTAR
ncbi:MAG TPA: GGDEF domain-containing protein [Telluria sp.]|jgi:diguanylate cyclase (GGDEF)-like protein